MHSAIYVTLISIGGGKCILSICAYFIDVLSIGVGRYMYPQYMCILLYVKLIWCNGIFHRSIVNWSRGVGDDVSSVYVHDLLYV